MANITKQLLRIRTELGNQDARRQRDERIIAKREREDQSSSMKRIAEGLEMVRELWKPFLYQLHGEVYDTKMFKEIVRFWDEFPTKFTSESYNWRGQRDQPYIPVYKGGVRLENDLITSHNLYLTPRGFRFEFDLDNICDGNWGGVESALNSECLLKMGSWQNPNMMRAIKKHNGREQYGFKATFVSQNLDIIVKYATPFFLCDNIELSDTGTIKDVFKTSLRKIRAGVQANIREAEVDYKTRVKELFGYIRDAIAKKDRRSDKEENKRLKRQMDEEENKRLKRQMEDPVYREYIRRREPVDSELECLPSFFQNHW